MNLFKGWKTRILNATIILIGVVELVDPVLLSTALGYGPQGKAALIITIGVVGFILRQFTNTEPPPMLPKRKDGAQ
jgi:hypothetical protein